MFRIFRSAGFSLWNSLLFGTLLINVPNALGGEPLPSIRHVQVLHGGSQVEIEIESSAPIVPQTNELGNPNRLLVDFVNATPGAELRSLKVNRTEVKDLRVSLFSSDPPVTRIVLDLNGPQPYQVFPSGRTTIVKIGAPRIELAGVKPSSGNMPDPAPVAPVAAQEPPKPTLSVSYHEGMLSINSDRASLSQVLFEIHQRTGAEIAIPAGAEQEKVAVDLGPGPASAVIAQLLNGSKFNFLILSSPTTSGAIDQVILTPRSEASVQAQAPMPQPRQPANEEPAEPPQSGPPGGNPPPDGQMPAPPNNEIPN